MKQKIVIKLKMECDKCRNKALKIAAEVPGVTAVSLEGVEKDCVAVTGDNVDLVCLANHLKKKFCSVIILSVEDLTKKAADEKKKKEEEEKKKKEEEEEKKKKQEEEEKKKKEEEELKKRLCCALSSTCHGKCKKPKCDGKCVIICVKCESPKCQCECNNKECSKCDNPKCDGHDCVKVCFKCESPKCKGQCKPPSPCYRPCPQWCTCPKCYVPYPYPCQVVYDSYSCPGNTCAIM